MTQEISASEAIFAFVAWLTTRPEPITMGSTFDAAPAASAIKEFLDMKELEQPGVDWLTGPLFLSEDPCVGLVGHMGETNTAESAA